MEKLELLVDSHLQDLHKSLAQDNVPNEETRHLIAAYARAAYAKGVTDSFADREGMLREFLENGYDLTKGSPLAP